MLIKKSSGCVPAHPTPPPTPNKQKYDVHSHDPIRKSQPMYKNKCNMK